MNFRFGLLLAGGIVLSMAQTSSAQLIRAPLDSGFARGSSIAVTVDEMLGPQKSRSADEPILGPGYPSLWIAEVQFKPVRNRLMEVVDPITRKSEEELVWYMVYRIIPRDYTELAGDSRDDLLTKLRDPNLVPQNRIDEIQGYPLQLPRFVLRTDDDGNNTECVDEVNHQVQRAVFEREFQSRAAHLRLLSSTDAITEVLDPVSVNDPDQLANAIYGVAIWRNVDPSTDYFTITMSGFSNAYRIYRNDNDEMVVEQKVIEQRFGRPGDEFEQRESEFRLMDSARLAANGDVIVVMDGTVSRFSEDDPAPAFVDQVRTELKQQRQESPDSAAELTWPKWKYQARPAQISVPKFEQILRNPRVAGPVEEKP
ncbi:MAG: hypothetical protein R3C59_19975 [Planctomycetaceae bacterium]